MIQVHRGGSLRVRHRSIILLSWLSWILAGAVALGAVVASPTVAWADEDEAVEAATKLNKKALEEYDNLSFDVARRTLEEALALCAKSGLDDHPIKARTYVHLGVVMLAAGAANHDDAVKQFQKALAIQPDIKLSSRIANPEVQSAFDQAKAAMPAVSPPTKQEKANAADRPPARSVAGSSSPVSATPGLSHDAVTSAPQNAAISISVTTQPSLAAKKVAVWFRPVGAPKFASIDLREYSAGNWSGSIPEGATAGDQVAYYISVENEGGEVVGTAGSAGAPIVTQLKGVGVVPSPNREAKREPDEPDETKPVAPPEEHTWFLSLQAGSGLGWASGNGDINDQDKVTSGFTSARLGQVVPEVGYFVSPDLILSLQLRLQIVSGATSERDLSGTMCGVNHVCEPAKGALAAFARATWLFGQGTVVPFLSAAVGAGQIRHLATFPKGINCGSDPKMPVQCVDTVSAGPILLGPGAGLIFHATNNFGLAVGVNTFLGFPTFTFHFDFNAGIVVEL